MASCPHPAGAEYGPPAPKPASGECRCAGCPHRWQAAHPAPAQRRVTPAFSAIWREPARHRQRPRAGRQSGCAANPGSAVHRHRAPAGGIPDLPAARPCANEFWPPAAAWQAIRLCQIVPPVCLPLAPCPRGQRSRRGTRSAQWFRSLRAPAIHAPGQTRFAQIAAPAHARWPAPRHSRHGEPAPCLCETRPAPASASLQGPHFPGAAPAHQQPVRPLHGGPAPAGLAAFPAKRPAGAL